MVDAATTSSGEGAMTTYGYLEWAGLLVILAVLGWIARGFSRRTFRIAVLAAVVACAIGVTTYGLITWSARHGRPPGSFDAAADHAGGRLEQGMLRPLLPGDHHVLPGIGGWIVLLILLGTVLAILDRICAHREQPRVQVSQAPAAQVVAGPAGSRRSQKEAQEPPSQAAVTERLQFRLPAVEVRKPAVMPGGSTLDNLAVVVSESGVQGSKVTAALMRAIRALQAQPRAYEARLLVERCDEAGQASPRGPKLQITVDLRNIRTEQSIVVRTLPPCIPAEAAERVAGFTARQVFWEDAATPSWATGAANGEDLSAYLLARQKSPQGRTFWDCYTCRQEQRELLENAVKHSPNAGAVQYDLACLCDLDGDSLESLLLHLDNRVHHPRFLRGRYRLAMSLGMLSTRDWFDREWHGQHAWPPPVPSAVGPRRDREAVKDDVIRTLRRSGMLRALSGRDQEREALTGEPDSGSADLARLALLRLARQEFRDYRASVRPWKLAWLALRHRPERDSLLAALRAEPRWWRHPRRHLLAASLSLEVVDHRIRCLTNDPKADERLLRAQARARRMVGLDERVDSGVRSWAYGKASWQAVYNAACLHAQPRSGNEPPTPAAVRIAVDLLRLAVSDQQCELVRPSEWIGIDPDLHGLRQHPNLALGLLPNPEYDGEFEKFLRAQAARDFDPADCNEAGDPWFRSYLPRTAGPAADGAAPPGGRSGSGTPRQERRVTIGPSAPLKIVNGGGLPARRSWRFPGRLVKQAGRDGEDPDPYDNFAVLLASLWKAAAEPGQ
jgi:hypothetical protein